MTQLAFGLMSAGYRADTVCQLVEALYPAPVIIHHDSHRFPALRLSMPNGHLVPGPVRTGWGTWELVEGMLLLIEHALAEHPFDYLAMVTPTCLPIRPQHELIDYLDGHPADAYLDCVLLDEDPEALLEFAYRVFFPHRSLRQRLMLRARQFALGGRYERIDRQGLNIARPARRDWRWHVGQRLARMALDGRFSSHPFGPGLRPAMSTTWFTASRPVLEHVLAFGRDPRVRAHYSRCRLIDENFFATAIASLGCRLEPMLHHVQPFDVHGRPATLDARGLADARASGRFFARKFADDPQDPVRLAALAAIGMGASQAAHLRAPAVQREESVSAHRRPVGHQPAPLDALTP